jgi:hypothetical protein
MLNMIRDTFGIDGDIHRPYGARSIFSFNLTHAFRRGLHSFAASRLLVISRIRTGIVANC